MNSNNTSSNNLNDPAFDKMLDEHFSNDASIRKGIAHKGLKRSDEAVKNLHNGIKKRNENGWLEKTLDNRSHKQENWKQLHLDGIEERNKNKTWLINVTRAIINTGNDPKVRKKRKETLDKKKQDPNYKLLCIEKSKKRRKPLVTPDGVFSSRREAAKYFNHVDSWVGSQIKNFPDKWYYITQEEYIMLTGKDI